MRVCESKARTCRGGCRPLSLRGGIARLGAHSNRESIAQPEPPLTPTPERVSHRLRAAVAALLMLAGDGVALADAQAEGIQASGLDVGDRRGGLLDEIVFATEPDVGKVFGLIEDGTYQLFAQGITNQTIFQRIRESAGVEHDLSYGSSVELTFNPAGPEFAGGGLNPFAVPEIREAMNWLVDRRHIAEEIYGGLARPRYLVVGTATPDYAALAAEAREIELRYQPDRRRAEEVVGREMEALGAEMRSGRWHHDGAPVTLRVLIRNDDIRRQVGDYVANRLEDIGFGVERMYRDAEEASRIWIGGDPAAGQWHVYTGAWVSTVVTRDTATSFDFYYTPRGRAEPLWQAYDPAPAFDEVSERLSRGDYADLEERAAMMARGLEMSMRDSARVWLVDQIQVGPRAADLAVSVDLAGGARGSQLWPLTAHYGDAPGGSARFAMPSVMTEPWNPVAGTNWLFDQMVLRAIDDSAFLPDPFTGLYRPQRVARAELTVQAGTPVTKTLDWLALEEAEEIIVPDDAWLAWDGAAGRFVSVAEAGEAGLTARTRSRIVFEDGYFDRRWHDGSTVSLADVLISYALTFARADPDSPLFDPGHVPAFESFERHFRGLRIASTDPLTVEVYSDQITPDAETIVARRARGTLPWHVMALAIMAEEAGDLAFSSDQADRLSAEWLSLVSGPSLPVLDRMRERAEEEGYLPFAKLLGAHVDSAEIAARYAALAEWRSTRGHYKIGDGPYYLDSVYPVQGALVLRHFADFPDPADKWLDFTQPPIPAVALDGPMMVAEGDGARFEIEITSAGAPYPAEDIAAAEFLLFDGDGTLTARGAAEAQDDGLWQVALSADQVAALGRGANSLEVVVTSEHVAMPVFASFAFATVPEGTRMLQ